MTSAVGSQVLDRSLPRVVQRTNKSEVLHIKRVDLSFLK